MVVFKNRKNNIVPKGVTAVKLDGSLLPLVIIIKYNYYYILLLARIATAVLLCWQQFFTTASTKTEIRSSSRPCTEENK